MSLAFRHRKHVWIERIYQASPAFIHDLIFSGYGLLKLFEAKKLYRKRVPQLEAFERQPISSISNYQKSKLLKLLKYANEYSPYYHEQFRKIGVDFEADHLDAEAILKSLPVLTKADIIAHYDFIASTQRESIASMPHSSGGTTGTTLNFLLDQGCYLDREAEVLAYWKRHGYTVGKEKTIMFRAGVLVPKDRPIKRPWRHDYGRNLLYLSSYYASPQFFDEYIQKLKVWKPKFMHALPSAAYLFACHILDRKETIPLEKVFSASEMLYPEQKKVLEQAFQCKVVDHYGHCEPGNYAAGQCNLDRYHIAASHVYTEVTEVGDILETALNNFSMPFLRYKVGDKSSGLKSSGCECGLNTPYLESIQGRDSEIIYTGDGRTVSSIGFDQIFRSNDIVLGQIIQEVVGELILKIVPMVSFSSASEQRLLGALRDRVGNDTTIKLIKTDAIESSASGKFRMVISRVNKNEH